MKIIILTAGLGTRLRPHTLTRPKALLKVAGRPVLAYILDKLIKLQTSARDLEFIFVNGWLGEQIVAYVQQEYVQTGKIRARFLEQVQPLGQAHAIGLGPRPGFCSWRRPRGNGSFRRYYLRYGFCGSIWPTPRK